MFVVEKKLKDKPSELETVLTFQWIHLYEQQRIHKHTKMLTVLVILGRQIETVLMSSYQSQNNYYQMNNFC